MTTSLAWGEEAASKERLRRPILWESMDSLPGVSGVVTARGGGTQPCSIAAAHFSDSDSTIRTV